MLSMMIWGPRQPGNDIDVYLSSLIEDLRKLWDEGVLVFDVFRKETFEMRATLCAYKSLLTLSEKKKLTTFMLIVMIMMKDN